MKKFDEILCRHQTICLCNVDDFSLISDLKLQVSQETSMDPSYFHLEAFIIGIKIILTESFPCNFFFHDDSTVVFIEAHHCSIELSKKAKFEQAINAIREGDERGLTSFFSACRSIEDAFLSRRHTNNWTLLHFASISSNDKIVSLLLALGWNCNEETDDFWTPLMLSSAHQQVRCAKMLLKHPSIQINKLTKKGSALHLAVSYGNFQMVLMLLNEGASCDLEDLNGKIPLELAVDKEIVELIPKFQGNRELQRYENNDKPPHFAGNLISYHAMRLYDKPVFVDINLETGTLDEYSEKDDYIAKQPPIASFKIKDILQIEPVKSKIWYFKSVYYFQLASRSGSKYYYTKHEEYRDEWIKYITQAIQYCQLHKIGFDNSNKSVFEVIDVQTIEESPVVIEKEHVSITDFDRIAEIGSGSFGTVYKVIKKDTGAVYAMKCLSKFFLNKKKMLKYAISEIKIMKQLTHPFILGLIFVFQNASSLYLILEYCEGGDLESLMEKRKISELEAKFYIAEVVLGLEHLHNLGIIYRDLKPANILLDSQGHVKLADFGLAKSFDEKEESVSTVVGTPAYISPEVISHEKLSKAVDIYTLGVVMHELLTGVIPFAELEIDKLFNSIRNGKFKFAESLEKNAKNLIKKLLTRKAKKRPNFEEIKKHEYFSGIDWDLLLSKRYLPPNGSKHVRVIEKV